MRYILAGMWLLTAAWAQAGELRDVRVLDDPEATRVVLDLDSRTGQSVFTLQNPDRVVIDLAGTRRAPGLKLDGLGKGAVKSVRWGPHEQGIRIVLDLDRPASPKSFGLQPASGYGYRLIVDLARSAEASATTPSTTAVGAGNSMPAPAAVQTAPPPVAAVVPDDSEPADPGEHPAVDRPAAQTVRPAVLALATRVSHDYGPTAAAAIPPPPVSSLPLPPAPAPPAQPMARAVPVPALAAPPPAVADSAVPLAAKPIVVAVDAGHGGDDPGARGVTGLLEKNVTLSIAQKLAHRIDATPGMHAVLTRDGDYYVGLRERTEKAREAQADLFVSVHCNAYQDADMQGTAVYVLSDHGASSEQARWVANHENAADLVGGVDLHDKDDRLAAVLIDISQSATMAASFDLGNRVLESMRQINELQKPQVQQAGFMVLKSPDIPSILVETAFLTNPREERMLRSPEYQEQFAEQIFHGIRGYFSRYRPLQQVAGGESPHRRARSRPVPVNYTTAVSDSSDN